MCAMKLLHIVNTDFLDKDMVRVRFADGTTAIFDSEELEKLRPRRKEYVDNRKIA